MMRLIAGTAAMAAMIAVAGPGGAQTAPDQTAPDQTAPEPQAEQAEEQDSLRIYFESGSARIGTDQAATLDQAARLFRDGSPIVMIVAGGADTVGSPDRNLDLSVARAQAVVDGLLARGIPADRLQLVGRGNSELAVDTPVGVDSRENRRVEITWR
jgi:outer membrane protein OmpA-like peptidoglycan-associated protein